MSNMGEELVPPDLLLNPQYFESTFYRRENYSQLRQLALSGHLLPLHNRFVSWRIFLGLLPENKSLDEWVEICTKLREDYRKLQESQCSVKTNNLDPLIFNPLSSATENPWNNFHVDNELKGIIRQDVDRTFQERLLFQLPEIKQLLTSILFTWSKQNSDISYKQGMNEILGIILFVAYAERAPETSEISPQAARYLSILNDPRYIEADSFWMFSRVMDLGIKELFNPVVTHKNKANKKNDLFSWDAEKERNDLVNTDKSHEENISSVLKRCHKIHHRLLQSIDRELYQHMESQKIEPQMYLQRWVRCMFTREFNMADTLVVWDSLFASLVQPIENNKDILLMDHICVAMIVFVRTFLLQSDYSGILRRLLKFPPVEDVHVLVNMGLSYKERIEGGKRNAPVGLIRSPEPPRAMIRAPEPKAKSPTEEAPKTIARDASPSLVQKAPEFSVPDPLAAKRQQSGSSPIHSDPIPQKSKPIIQTAPLTKAMSSSEKINSAIDIVQEQINNETYSDSSMKYLLELLKQLKDDIKEPTKPSIPDPLRRI
ncbi:unnamed protein product [Blepharisma stoltei]|uniref:Rab-GAP TBC domain-containing protein n=1 Tax=Blepharisma stoltei TaxID=1481888 RepID=A0AAU9J9B8_9CILI|nr:unnamed protein product [Blepharisma stoltei]